MEQIKQPLILLIGAVVGGFIGYHGCDWILRHGFYAMVLPGGLLGFGAGFAKNRSVLLAALCGIAAIALGLYSEWKLLLYVDSFSYFLQHVFDVNPVPLLMIAAGGFLGFWMPFRSIQRFN
ncbi:MAG: hypothetical protein IID45_12335 [Planctomycetes bacterium]|nr:hypothetical protein [Planctomycetota bacterium]